MYICAQVYVCLCVHVCVYCGRHCSLLTQLPCLVYAHLPAFVVQERLYCYAQSPAMLFVRGFYFPILLTACYRSRVEREREMRLARDCPAPDFLFCRTNKLTFA